VDQAADAAAGQTVVSPPPKPPVPASTQSVAKLQQELLLRENFSFIPAKMLDPFSPVSVITEVPGAGSGEDEGNMPPEPKAPLTPLQKMSLGEIEKGLKAIMWGDMGRRALIEDGSGKGYIVGEGTPLGDHEGVVTQIFNDHLIIQQSFWDRTEKKVVAQNSMVRLKKVGDGK
jgi:Tfp pilus assembly protein PilP